MKQIFYFEAIENIRLKSKTVQGVSSSHWKKSGPKAAIVGSCETSPAHQLSKPWPFVKARLLHEIQ